MELKNTTAALVQSLGSNEVRLVRLEFLVIFSFLSWHLLEQFISRQRYSHGFFRILGWTVYTLSTVLAPYTIGLLQAGPFRDQTFVLWGTLLLLIQVNSKYLSVYSMKDSGQIKRMLVQQVLQIFLVLWLVVNSTGGNKSYRATIWMFWTYSIILTIRKFGILIKASKREGLVEQCKVIADYMMVEHQLGQDIVDPSTMEGYRYIFHGEEELASLLPTAPGYRIGLKQVTDSKFITIDSVWRWVDSRSFPHKESPEKIKEITLSFTLFKLLKRRFCGYYLSEAGLDKTLHLVLHGLLSEEGNYVRAFRVIEVELSFMYDFFYTKMDSGYVYKYFTAPILLTAIVWNSISGAFSRHYHRSNLEQRVIGTDLIRWITILLLVNFLFVHIVAPFTRLSSLGTVNIVRMKIEDEREKPGTTTVTYKIEDRETWERKLGQYSLLLNFHYRPQNVLSFLSLGLIEAKRNGQKSGEKIKLAEGVIISVLSQFKENNGKLENGQSALARNQLGSQLSWACTLPTHIHTILVWHIATTIFGYKVSPEVPCSNAHRLVAQSISDYCAYLVAFIPDMLPGHGYDTRRIFDAVVMEARQCLDEYETVSRICEKLMTDSDGVVDGTILNMGAKLGRELRDMDTDEAWKVLADFWGEFILFLAPSDNVDIHAEKLAAGGEFMTHLWAMLTHAGIMERPCSSSGVDPLGGSDGTTTQGSGILERPNSSSRVDHTAQQSMV